MALETNDAFDAKEAFQNSLNGDLDALENTNGGFDNAEAETTLAEQGITIEAGEGVSFSTIDKVLDNGTLNRDVNVVMPSYLVPQNVNMKGNLDSANGLKTRIINMAKDNATRVDAIGKLDMGKIMEVASKQDYTQEEIGSMLKQVPTKTLQRFTGTTPDKVATLLVESGLIEEGKMYGGESFQNKMTQLEIG